MAATYTATPDLIERHFSAAALNRLWVADLTRIPTGSACCGRPVCAMRSPTAS